MVCLSNEKWSLIEEKFHVVDDYEMEEEEW